MWRQQSGLAVPSLDPLNFRLWKDIDAGGRGHSLSENTALDIPLPEVRGVNSRAGIGSNLIVSRGWSPSCTWRWKGASQVRNGHLLAVGSVPDCGRAASIPAGVLRCGYGVVTDPGDGSVTRVPSVCVLT